MSPKRLGKGLEDISHLFLSNPSSPSYSNRPHSTPQKHEEASKSQTRVLMAMSLVPRIPSAFFAANLSVEMARAGRRVLAIETAPLPSLDGVLGTVQIQPSLNELLDQPKKQIAVEGPMGMKVLSFQLRLEELQGLVAEEQEILSQVLRKEEENSDLILIHAGYEEDHAFKRWVGMVQGAVLTVDLDSLSLLQVYQACKFLYHTHPDLSLGLIVFGKEEKETVAGEMQKLIEAATRFLGKSLAWYGVIPEDPLIERSLAAKVPLTILAQASKVASGFSSAVENILLGCEKNLGGESSYSFFDRLRRTTGGAGSG
jgi:flagellar biosynthesis protein FlhG